LRPVRDNERLNCGNERFYTVKCCSNKIVNAIGATKVQNTCNIACNIVCSFAIQASQTMCTAVTAAGWAGGLGPSHVGADLLPALHCPEQNLRLTPRAPVRPGQHPGHTRVTTPGQPLLTYSARSSPDNLPDILVSQS
jgi:hypothetical protein